MLLKLWKSSLSAANALMRFVSALNDIRARARVNYGDQSGWPVKLDWARTTTSPMPNTASTSTADTHASPQCVVQDHDHGGEPRAADDERENILQQLD
jgi:hypothetical protein